MPFNPEGLVVRDYVAVLKDRNILLLVTSSITLSMAMGFLAWFLPLTLAEVGGALAVGACFAIALSLIHI